MADPTHRRRTAAARPDLTAAAWNRRRVQPTPPLLAHWLRTLPEAARIRTVLCLFGALFFTIPGSVLLLTLGTHAPWLLSAGVWVFVCVLLTVHAVAALGHAGAIGRQGDRLRRMAACAPYAVVAATGLPFASACVLALPIATETLAWLGGGALAYGTGLLLPRLLPGAFMQTLSPALMVLGSVLHFIAVASLTTTYLR